MKARSSPALPGCRIQLELVEDKLRELRLLTLDPREYDDRTVTMSQLDRVRQELLATARSELRCVTFGQVRSRRMLRKPSSARERPRQCPQLVWSSDASPSARRTATLQKSGRVLSLCHLADDAVHSALQRSRCFRSPSARA